FISWDLRGHCFNGLQNPDYCLNCKASIQLMPFRMTFILHTSEQHVPPSYQTLHRAFSYASRLCLPTSCMEKQ
ncbi:hypothetical protein STEG23_022774, partial [Scotinomys teguina]